MATALFAAMVMAEKVAEREEEEQVAKVRVRKGGD